MTNLHIHAPEPTVVRLRVLRCPKCKRRRRCDVKFYEWYEPLIKCRTCKKDWSIDP